VFIVPGVNTSADQIKKMKGLVERIRPDKVQLNTAVRPPAEQDVQPASHETLVAIARQMGDNCDVIADVPVGCCDRQAQEVAADVLSMLKRRPCSVHDLCAGLGITAEEASTQLTDLESHGSIVAEPRGTVIYFRARSRVT